MWCNLSECANKPAHTATTACLSLCIHRIFTTVVVFCCLLPRFMCLFFFLLCLSLYCFLSFFLCEVLVALGMQGTQTDTPDTRSMMFKVDNTVLMFNRENEQKGNYCTVETNYSQRHLHSSYTINMLITRYNA